MFLVTHFLINCIKSKNTLYVFLRSITMDLQLLLKDAVIDFICSLNKYIYIYVVRTGFFLVSSLFLLRFFFYELRSRSIFSQIIALILSIIITFSISLEKIKTIDKTFCSLIFILSLLCCIFLPLRVAHYIVPEPVYQIKLIRFFYYLIIILFIFQIIFS